MNAVSKGDIIKVINAARKAAENGYAPYSKFRVGAAVMLSDGAIITGANFENASFGLSLCAETVAIANANSSGHTQAIRMLAVAGGTVDTQSGKIGFTDIKPCGRCRQILSETSSICRIDIPVFCATKDGYTAHLTSALLPYGFSLPDENAKNPE